VADETDRPQDAARPPARRRRGIPSAEALVLLERYRTALRDELGETLTELRPAKGARPALAQRLKLWDLALKLARELASGSDIPEPPAAPVASGTSGATRGAAPKLTRRERARLE
jgi:hypothetical protein